MHSSKLRVAVVGCNIGRAHVAAFQELPDCFELKAVCDLDLGRARGVAGEFSVPEAVDDFSALCRRRDIDVVSLCTPPSCHREQIIAALVAGKQVVCEKPLVGSLAEIDELVEMELRTGRKVMPIFQNRFGHGIQKLKYLVELGLAGPAYLTTVETAWRRGPDYYSTPWRNSWQGALGGCLLQQGIHAHDTCSYIVGPVRNVYALAATRVNQVETEDCAVATAQLMDGSLATFAVTLGSAEEITRHRFCFRNLTAESNTSAYENTRDPWRFIGRLPEDERLIQDALRAFRPEPEGYAGQFLRYHQALATDTELPVGLGDARAAIELATALYYAIETEKPVTLPLAPTHPRYGGWCSVNHRAAPAT